MVEVVRASKQDPFAFIDRISLSKLVPYGLPVLMALVCAISLGLTVQRAGVLRTWSDTYSGAGSFLVESCSEVDAFGADRWACVGRLTVDGNLDRDPVLTTSRGAVASDRPHVGQRLEVFFHQEDTSVVYPLQFRLNEIARVYLSFLPRLLFFVGAVVWLAGWFLTRSIDREDYLTRDRMRLPQRFTWKSRGLSWIGAAVLVLALNHLLATRIIGSLDII